MIRELQFIQNARIRPVPEITSEVSLQHIKCNASSALKCIKKKIVTLDCLHPRPLQMIELTLAILKQVEENGHSIGASEAGGLFVLRMSK